MQLMTKAIAKKLFDADQAFQRSPNGETSDEIVVKYFNPCGAATWWIVQGNPLDTPNGEPTLDYERAQDWHLFGWCDLGYGGELGYVLLSELQGIRLMAGLGIERDLYLTDHSLKELMAKREAA